MPPPSFQTISRRMATATIMANSAGALATFLFFNLLFPLPTGTASLRSADMFDVAIFGGTLVIGFVLGNLWNQKSEAGIRDWYDRLQHGANPDELPDAVRRGVLNRSPRITLTSLGVWFLVGTAFTLLQQPAPLEFSATLFGGIVGIGGVLTSAVVYFACDLAWRPAYAVFFSTGRLSAACAFFSHSMISICWGHFSSHSPHSVH